MSIRYVKRWIAGRKKNHPKKKKQHIEKKDCLSIHTPLSGGKIKPAIAQIKIGARLPHDSGKKKKYDPF